MILFSFDDVAWLNHDITFDVGCIMTNDEGYVYIYWYEHWTYFSYVLGICDVKFFLYPQLYVYIFNRSIYYWPFENYCLCWNLSKSNCMLKENFLLPWLQWSEPKNTDRIHVQTVLRGIIHKELQPLRKFCKLSIK